jgi:hypothetical protein
VNRQEFLTLFPNATESVIAANIGGAELSGERPADKEGAPDAVRPELEQRPPTRTPRPKRTKVEDSKRFLVRVTSVRKCLIDEDNLCEKYVVDCCRYAGLLPGDGPGTTKIDTAQRKAGKGEAERTIVEIYEVIP